MKKTWKIAAAAVFAAAIGASACYYMLEERRADVTPPVINCGEDALTVSIQAADEDLLSGVSAWDDRDGDISDQVLVEGLSKFTEPGKSTVTYVVADSGGNVAKKTRPVFFEDYTGPEFFFKDELRVSAAQSEQLLDIVGARDCIDGDISGRVKLSVKSGSLSEPGECRVELRVTNSMGDTVKLEVPVTVYSPGDSSQAYSPRVRLSSYIVYLDKGGSFSARGLIEGVEVKVRGEEYAALELDDDQTMIPVGKYPYGRITVWDSKLDADTPGVYRVTYRTAMDGYSGETLLTVVVREDA